MAWYWWAILGILVGWVSEWLFEIICWRWKRRRSYEARIEDLEGSLDECHRGVVHLRGELERRDLRIVDLKKGLSAGLDLPAVATNTPEARAADLPSAAPDLHPKAPLIDVEAPVIEVTAPKLHVEVPSIEVAARDLQIGASDIDVTAPDLQMELPAIDLALSALDVEAPSTDVEALEVKLEMPEIDVRAAPVRVDDLTLIRGVGPKMSATLGAAGITSFAQLAEMDGPQLQGVIQAPDWQRVDYGDWVLQAQTLSDLPPAAVGDDLTAIEGVGPKYAGLLRDAGITTFAGLADREEEGLKAIINAPSWRRVDYPMWIRQARLIVSGEHEALAQLQGRLHTRGGDNLTLVAGIGDKAKAALLGAGVSSFADLAAADEARLAGIIEGAGLRVADYGAWREEADLRAAGKRVSRVAAASGASEGIPAQDLAAIWGIGPIFELKFYQAGIGTYTQLAALSDADVRAIIQPEEWQDFDYKSWNEQARRLAEDTSTVRSVWNGIIPDDLSKIKGVGDVAERRLFEAGIMTFADLAAATVAQLEAIVQPLSWQNVDLASWIAQAGDLT